MKIKELIEQYTPISKKPFGERNRLKLELLKEVTDDAYSFNLAFKILDEFDKWGHEFNRDLEADLA